jgi:hypothetical protein
MANPFAVQAQASLPKGAGQPTDNITNIVSAGTKFARGLGALNWSGTSALRYDGIISLKFKTNATTTTGNKVASLYLITSMDGASWTDGIDPDATSDQSSKINQAPCFYVQTGIVAATTYFVPDLSIPAFLGFMPLYWAVVYQLDVTAGGFSATAADHLTKYTDIPYA